jgi:cytosine/adenosine deaminase-related metal-dependent hydrolase
MNTASFEVNNVRIPRSVRGFDSTAQDSDYFDVFIENQALALIKPTQSATDLIANSVRMLLPAFVDLHLHIDKTFVVDEVGAAEGDLFAAIERMAKHRDGWSAEQIERISIGWAKMRQNPSPSLKSCAINGGISSTCNA